MKIEIKDISDILVEAKKELEMSKEELLHKLWDTQDIVHKAIEYIENTRVDNNYMVQEKYEYLLKILKGEE